MHRRDALRLIGLAAAAAAGGGWAGAAPAPHVRRIPGTGESLPVIGLGTWQTFDAGPSPAERDPLQEVLSTFVALGGKLVDSSPMYGRAEEVLGDLAAALAVRDRLFLATKVWTRGKAEGIAQMEASLRKMRAKGLDLIQVHNLLDAGTHLDTLQAWKDAGRVRYLGVTHYTAGAHDDVAALITRRKVDFVQINYSAGEREAERRLLPLCRDRGIAVIANRPFAGGDLFARLRARPLPPWAAEIDCTSWAQILLKFVVSHPAVTCAIPATSKVAHLRDNMQAGLGRLPDEPMRRRIGTVAG